MCKVVTGQISKSALFPHLCFPNYDFTPKARTWIQACHCTAGFSALPSSANLFQALRKHRHCLRSVNWPRPIYWPIRLEYSLFSLNTADDGFVFSELMKSAASCKSSTATANTAFDACVPQNSGPSSSSLSLSICFSPLILQCTQWDIIHHGRSSWAMSQCRLRPWHSMINFTPEIFRHKKHQSRIAHRPENMHRKHQIQCHFNVKFNHSFLIQRDLDGLLCLFLSFIIFPDLWDAVKFLYYLNSYITLQSETIHRGVGHVMKK